MGSYISIVNDTNHKYYCKVDDQITMKTWVLVAGFAAAFLPLIPVLPIHPGISALVFSPGLALTSEFMRLDLRKHKAMVKKVGVTKHSEAENLTTQDLHAIIDAELHDKGFKPIEPEDTYTSEKSLGNQLKAVVCYSYAMDGLHIDVHKIEPLYGNNRRDEDVKRFYLSSLTPGETERVHIVKPKKRHLKQN
uniref:AlNc14C40G3438 protein n=1 Tax=Albugo laibachii Nc14 TaxID=890382 RepID=F0W9H9_9STRA|nr:AlNc14C40G3438 [Albugo laibachii Nc14]|eukprot:CCA17793.1 AlNc14C40G3438 [Albugo laibachii Nc14]